MLFLCSFFPHLRVHPRPLAFFLQLLDNVHHAVARCCHQPCSTKQATPYTRRLATFACAVPPHQIRHFNNRSPTASAAPRGALHAGRSTGVAPRGSLHEGRSTGVAPRGPLHGEAADLFYTDVRSILMVLRHFKGTTPVKGVQDTVQNMARIWAVQVPRH